MLKKGLIGLVLLIVMAITAMNFYIPGVSESHGKVQTTLYLGKGENQPLVVGFGGGEGGNAWESDRWKQTRDEFLEQGYAFLAVGYFGGPTTPGSLDRISLDAIHDSIISIAANPMIDASKIALIGGSKGAELALNLASRYPQYGAVVGIVPSHVSFPATTIQALTSSWTHNGEEVPYVPMPLSAVPAAMKQDLHSAFSIMLQDTAAVSKATIQVEHINGPVLLLSATQDEMWPSTYMSEQLMKRFKQKNFKFRNQHIPIAGGHTVPLEHFNLVIDFLNQHFKKQNSLTVIQDNIAD